MRFLHSPGGDFGLFLFFLCNFHSEEEINGQKFLLPLARITIGQLIRQSKMLRGFIMPAMPFNDKNMEILY